MVDEIDPILPTQATVATKINDSTSIAAEPDRAWVAARQDAITTALGKRKELTQKPPNNGDDDANAHHRRPGLVDQFQAPPDEMHPAEEKLSGESARIGTGNWDDDDIPFGKHVGFL